MLWNVCETCYYLAFSHITKQCSLFRYQATTKYKHLCPINFPVLQSVTTHRTETGDSFHKPASCPVVPVRIAVLENERNTFRPIRFREIQQCCVLMKCNLMCSLTCILLFIITIIILLRQVRVPQKDTTYWCQIHKFPELEKKHHVIKVSMFVF